MTSRTLRTVFSASFLALLCVLAVLLPSSAAADGVAPSLYETLLRLPTSEARRARLVQALGAPDLDALAKEQLGTALSVLGTLDAADRDDDYILRLFLAAALSTDAARRDEALSNARRGRGPPAPDDTSEVQAEASAYLLERELLEVNGRNGRFWVTDFDGVRQPLSRFVYRVRDEEIRAVLERESRTSWGVFGGLFLAGFVSAVSGGVSLVAASDGGFDGSGAGRAPNPDAAQAVGTSLISVGTGLILGGVMQRSVVATNHRVGYRRYYTEQRLREVVRKRNAKAAAEMRASPVGDDP